MFGYTDVHNALHFLDEEVTNNEYEMHRLDQIYSAKAVRLCKKENKSVFYCLKLFNDKKTQIIQGNYFLIPIEQEDIDRIDEKFRKRCYIGIVNKGTCIAK